MTVTGTEISLKANRAGLVSLARHLLTLAQDQVHEGAHVHLTAYQENESDRDLILERAGPTSKRPVAGSSKQSAL